MSKFSDFFQPHRLGFHLLLAVGITLILFVIATICLRIYTHHGRELEMPNFVGQDSNVLLKDSLSKDFIIVVSDFFYDRTTKPGTVLKQNPLPNEKVKKGRKVYLTVASSVPPKVNMPPLQDISLRQAEIMLNASGLILDNVIYKPSPYENAVLEQLYNGRVIAPGTEIDVGERITLVVGKDVDDLPPGNDSIPSVPVQ